MIINFKKHYIYFNFLICLFSISKADSDVTTIGFSYNRPLQLEAFLRSLYLHVNNLGQVYIIYRSDKPFELAYEKLKSMYPKTIFFRQIKNNKVNNFKELLLKAFRAAKSYVVFAPDDLIVTDKIDLKHCIEMIQKTGTYGFYLRLGLNITYSYMSKEYSGIPKMKVVDEDVYCWQFKSGKAVYWTYPHTLDFAVIAVKDIKNFFEYANYNSPNTLEYRWSLTANLNKFGLCYKTSKVVNVPLNVIQTDINNSYYLTKHLSVYDLLNVFNSGKVIDIDKLYKMNYNSPHIEYPISYKYNN